MSKFRISLVACCCVAMTTVVGADVIGSDPSGNYYVEGEASDFVNWASTNHSVSVLAGQTMMQTIFATDKGFHYTTAPTNLAQADMDIQFQFERPLVTCRLDYGSVIDQAQTGDAFVQLEVTAKAVKTLIYFHQPWLADNSQAGSFNYTPAGGIPNGVDGDSERHRAYTDIDALVAGETEFTLNIAVYFGTHGEPNASEIGGTLLNMGGSFLPDREVPLLWPESDFIMSGTMDPPGPCSGFYSQNLAGDISGPEGVPDCYVDLYDLGSLGQLWLECTDPNNIECIQ
jgi:hypothetical protein